jgi:hypothetical protein
METTMSVFSSSKPKVSSTESRLVDAAEQAETRLAFERESLDRIVKRRDRRAEQADELAVKIAAGAVVHARRSADGVETTNQYPGQLKDELQHRIYVEAVKLLDRDDIPAAEARVRQAAEDHAAAVDALHRHRGFHLADQLGAAVSSACELAAKTSSWLGRQASDTPLPPIGGDVGALMAVLDAIRWRHGQVVDPFGEARSQRDLDAKFYADFLAAENE